MRWTLKQHPDSRASAVTRIEVEVGRPSANQLRLRYAVSGAPDLILVPAPADPERTDQLWRSTCFEAFARQAGAEQFLVLPAEPALGEQVRQRRDGAEDARHEDDLLGHRV